MSLESFRVTKQKSLVLAECPDVPPLMVVTGPNGVGKSSLLYALKRRDGAVYTPDTQVLYQPPHRAIRRQQVRRRWVQTSIRGFTDLLAGDDVGGYEGLNIQFPQRAPDNVDESGSTLKYSMGRVENRRQGALAGLVDDAQENGQPLDTAPLPDVYGPLKRLVTTLVPHLEFRGISFINEDDIRLTFRIAGTEPPTEVDLDDLSSGEKAILLLFMPLIEAEIDTLLEMLTHSPARPPAEGVSRVFLIDEPEQHLHPELQGRVLAYLRAEAARTNLQAILTTHSPALLDLASDTELFVLSRPDGERNQLSRIADSTERLDALKDLVGNPYVVTTGRTIVLVEGTPGGGRNTDVRLLDRIHPSATRFSFVPMGGRGSVVAAVRGLRDEISEATFGISILGIVDRDREATGEQGVVAWPFAMIENLLLGDSAAIAAAALAVGNLVIREDTIERALDEVAASMREDEVRLRVQDLLKPRMVRVAGTSVAEVKANLDAAKKDLEEQYADDDRLAEILGVAESEVAEALADGSFRASFRGKKLLHGLLDRLGMHNVSYNDFLYALADACAASATVQTQITEVFESLNEARSERLVEVARVEVARVEAERVEAERVEAERVEAWPALRALCDA